MSSGEGFELSVDSTSNRGAANAPHQSSNQKNSFIHSIFQGLEHLGNHQSNCNAHIPLLGSTDVRSDNTAPDELGRRATTADAKSENNSKQSTRLKISKYNFKNVIK